MQGRLRNQKISVTARTECAHCKKSMELLIDSDLNYTVKDKTCEPIVFMPDVDLMNLKDESIISAF